jgi:hypothetical protein
MKKIFLAIPAATIIGICFAAQIDTPARALSNANKPADMLTFNSSARLPVIDPSPIDPIDPIDPSAGPTIYAAGKAMTDGACTNPSAGGSQPAMWINGQILPLDCDPTTIDSEARSISISEDPWFGSINVTVAGSISYVSNTPHRQGMVWQNGTPQPSICDSSLSGAPHCSADAVYVSDSGVQYVAGYQDLSGRPGVWINGGEATSIDNGAHANSIADVAEDNGNLYVAGGPWGTGIYTQNNPIQSAWLNIDGLKLAVSPSEPARVTGLVIRNGVVYMSGYTYNVSTNKHRAAYWVYNSAVSATPQKYNMPMPSGATSSYGTGIDMDAAGNVFISGYEQPISGGNSRARLWRNAISQPIQSSFVTNSVANAIRVHNGVVYLGGQISNRPAIWKNGTPEMYPGSAQAPFNTQGTIYAIDVR